MLSYPSQDIDAARRSFETLRTAGLEVWFDESELCDGDAWDASIRRQIQADAQLYSFGHVFEVRFWTALLDRYLGLARSFFGAEAETVWQAGRRMGFEAALAEANVRPVADE